MKYLFNFLVLFYILGSSAIGVAQEDTARKQSNALFSDDQPLKLKLQYSIKNLRKKTNDSTYIQSALLAKTAVGWDSLPIDIRARGNFRRDHCYYVPVKVKIDKKKAKGTVYEENRKLKLVLPCLMEAYKNDYVLKEYLAYSFFELISPYHYKTRLVDIEFQEEKGERIKEHRLRGFFIEDSDKVEDRLKGKEVNRKVHPMQQDALNAIRNDLFQFMIGNTDYSTKQGHNEKLFYLDGKYICLPYDFDMSGLVNASYANVSNVQNLSKSISEVTQRAYKGYQRDRALVEQVRREYLDHEGEILKKLQEMKLEFESEQQYQAAEQFLAGFFNILKNDARFEKQVVKRARPN
ncbi:MAG: hypothetical protein KJP14_07375 [Eudoraea sp.]|nr:hypothetical protein [Eudoraea sp.]MBT8210331.1 hypothetical protein [Eudoraea sp.]